MGRRTRVVPEITLYVPIKKIIKKLVEKKFLRWNSDGTYLNGTAIRALVNWDHADIVRYYNSTIKGLLNYYSFATNYHDFGMLVRLIRLSCARTLALKYKTRYANSIFTRFGKNLVDPESKVGLNLPTSFHFTRKFFVSAANPLHMVFSKSTSKRTKSKLFLSCIICGGTPVEIHHVRKLKDLKKRLHLDWFDMQMAALAR